MVTKPIVHTLRDTHHSQTLPTIRDNYYKPNKKTDMKNLLLAISLIFTSAAFAQENKSETLALDSIITIINNSLNKANENLEDKNLDIKSAEIALKTSYVKSGGGGFKLFVKASKKWELEKASTLTFVYEKPTEKSLEFVGITDFEEKLTNAIVEAATQWQNATETINGLSKSTFSVDLSFSVKKANEGGIEFEIWGVGIDVGVDYENTAVHELSLTFK